MSYTEAQQRALALTPKFTAGFSIPCSVYILYNVAQEHASRVRKGSTTTATHRALASMSAIDILASSGWFLSTWAVPSGTDGVAFATGNQGSCSYQGFLLQLAIGAPMFNASLGLYYMLSIVYDWKDDALLRIERRIRPAILLYSVGTSILCLPLGLYNHIGTVCWIMGKPQGCGNSNYNAGTEDCERGDHAWLYGLALFYGPLWVCIVFTTGCMVRIYLKVKEVERKNSKYAGARHEKEMRRSGLKIRRELSTTTAGNGVDNNGSMPRPPQQARPPQQGAQEAQKRLTEATAATEVDERRFEEEEERPQQDRQESTVTFDVEAATVGRKSRRISLIGFNMPSGRRRSSAAANASNAPREATTSSRRKTSTSSVAVQAILYTCAFYVTWMPSTIWSIATWFDRPMLWLDMLAAVCEPMQGFLNLLVFLRPRDKLRARLRRDVWDAITCEWCRGEEENETPRVSESTPEDDYD